MNAWKSKISNHWSLISDMKDCWHLFQDPNQNCANVLIMKYLPPPMLCCHQLLACFVSFQLELTTKTSFCPLDACKRLNFNDTFLFIHEPLCISLLWLTLISYVVNVLLQLSYLLTQLELCFIPLCATTFPCLMQEKPTLVWWIKQTNGCIV